MTAHVNRQDSIQVATRAAAAAMSHVHLQVITLRSKPMKASEKRQGRTTGAGGCMRNRPHLRKPTDLEAGSFDT